MDGSKHNSSGRLSNEGEKSAPVFPLFVQMNVLHEVPNIQWKETSRWVKFQEDVEEGGKRWSKPFVPALQFAAIAELRRCLQEGVVHLNVKGSDIDEVIDNMSDKIHDECGSESNPCLSREQCDSLKQLLNEEAKLRIKTGFLSMFHHSNTNGSGINSACQTATSTPAPNAKNEHKISILKKKMSFVEAVSAAPAEQEEVHESSSRKRNPSSNPFAKKIAKGAESALVQVATVDFLEHPVVLFLRFEDAFSINHLCEIPSAETRFLCIILGPHKMKDNLIAIGKVLGALMSDQIFPMVAYRAETKDQVIKALESYTSEVVILAPSVWDPSIRLEPPEKLPSLSHRAQLSRINTRHFFENENQKESKENPEEAEGLLANFDSKLQHDLYKQLEQEQIIERKETLPSEEDQQPHEDIALQRTGKIFGGLVADVKRKLPFYVSDFRDAIHVQSLASVIYIYLATITKAITFGGFLGDITQGQQGVLESFLGHAIAGGFFCLFGGQPLTVLGCTGPVLVFEKILVDFCNSYELHYMNFRLYIGLWSCFFCLIIVALDLSAFVRYFTRFTEESFASLIGLIFIAESLTKLYKLSKQYKVHAGFELSHLSFEEEACHCIKPDNFTVMYDNITENYSDKIGEIESRLNGSIDSANDIPWDSLTLDECSLFGGHLSGIWCSYVPDIFFFSVTLFFGTFLLALYLKTFKYTRYFPSVIRSLVSDFAVILSILVFVAVDEYFLLETPKLIVPTIFKPTRSDIRGWLIPFWVDGMKWYICIAAAVPALLLTILLFMDQQITSVIVNRKEHKLKKGCGYHLDMFIIAITMAVCSITGLPWCVAATVLCLGHVDSLKMETEASAPGEKPTFLGVREQRVTGTMVFLLTGLSVKLAPILRYIPMPVLYGVLLYMGVMSLKGMQFVDRILLMLMPPKYQPDYLYLRHVPLTKVHLFTLVQITSLALLWILKSTSASLIFPLMVLALVGFRKMMDYFPKIFSQQDLFWLDNLMPADSGKKKKKSKDDGESEKKVDQDDEEEDDIIPVNEQFIQISGPTLNETFRRASICQRHQKETSLC